MAFDVASVRGHFPSLGDGWIHLDPQAGMQIPDSVATAVSRGFRQLPTTPGGVYPSSRAAAGAVDTARRAVADLLAARPGGVVLGPSRGVLVNSLCDALDPMGLIGSQIVLSRLDDEPNIRPWLRLSSRLGLEVRWAEVDIETGGLPAWQFKDLINENTSVVAVTLASTTTGAVTDISEIAALAREAGALLVLDATNAAPYLSLDIAELGADVVLVSAERWGGPRLAAMVFADPEHINRLRPVSMDPAARGPQRLEIEPHQGALLAGLTASIEHLAALDDAVIGKRRRRLAVSMDSTYEYLNRLTYYLVESLSQLGQTSVVGTAEPRVPLVSFTVAGVGAESAVRRLASQGICALHGVPSRALEAVGVDDVGGAVTVGLSPYSTPYEVDQLVRTLGSLG